MTTIESQHAYEYAKSKLGRVFEYLFVDSTESKEARSDLAKARNASYEKKGEAVKAAETSLANLFTYEPALALSLASDNFHSDADVRYMCIKLFCGMATNNEHEVQTMGRLVPLVQELAGDTTLYGPNLFAEAKRTVIYVGREALEVKNIYPAEKTAEIVQQLKLLLSTPGVNTDVANLLKEHGYTAEAITPTWSIAPLPVTQGLKEQPAQ